MINVVRELPPRDSCKMRVSFESRYGTCVDWQRIQRYEGVTRNWTHFAICQAVDDHTQRRQRLVDLLGLLQSLSTSTSLADFFRACQVDEIEVARLLTSRFDMSLMDADNEDRMRAG